MGVGTHVVQSDASVAPDSQEGRVLAKGGHVGGNRFAFPEQGRVHAGSVRVMVEVHAFIVVCSAVLGPNITVVVEQEVAALAPSERHVLGLGIGKIDFVPITGVFYHGQS